MHLSQPKKSRRRTSPEALSPLVIDEAERAAQVIAEARARLKPFADLTRKRDIFKTHRYLGAFDGVGAMLQLASLDASRLDQFRAEAGGVIERVESAALNYTIVFSLLITVTIPLAALHAGNGAYQLTPEAQAKLFQGVSSIDSLAYADAASFIAERTSAAEDVASQAHTLRAVFYALECAMLALGVTATCVGLFKSVALYIAFNAALPSVVARCEHLVQHHRRLVIVYYFMQQGGVATSMYAVAFITARSSAVAFFAQSACLLLAHFAFINDQCGGGQLASLIWQQHREARRLFAANPASTAVVQGYGAERRAV